MRVAGVWYDIVKEYIKSYWAAKRKADGDSGPKVDFQKPGALIEACNVESNIVAGASSL